MTVELGASFYPEITTLAEMKEVLESLTLDGKYEYGGDECIEYFINGEIICHEIEDEDVSAMIEIFDEAGKWPWINVMRAKNDMPSDEECRAMLEKLDYDYQALWKWIRSQVMGESQ